MARKSTPTRTDMDTMGDGPAVDQGRALDRAGEPSVAGLELGRTQAVDTLKALQATGIQWGEAVGMVASALGMEAAKPLYDKKVARLKRPEVIVGLLSEIAKTSPQAANAWLGDGLSSGKIDSWTHQYNYGLHFTGATWLTSLPDGLQVKGGLYLQDCTGLMSLPTGMHVQGGALTMAGCRSVGRLPEGLHVHFELNLLGCVSLSHLPANLYVGRSLMLDGCSALTTLGEGMNVGWLDLRGCPAWDGRIPDDATIRCNVITDKCSGGILLDHWRAQFPEGEASDAQNVRRDG